MNNPDSQYLELIKSYIENKSAPIIMETGCGVQFNIATQQQIPDWDGNGVSFVWSEDPSHDTDKFRGRITISWSDSSGRRHLLIAGGYRAVISLPDESVVCLSSFGVDSHTALLSVVSAFYAYVIFSHPKLVNWARDSLNAIPLYMSLKSEDIKEYTRLYKQLEEESGLIHERVSNILRDTQESVVRNYSSTKLIDTDKLQLHQDTLAEVFEVSAFVVDTFGIPITRQSAPNPLVGMLWGNSEIKKLITAEFEELIKEAGGGAPVHKTLLGTGLHTAAVPFMCGRLHIATWIIGNVKLSSSHGIVSLSGNMKESDQKRITKLYDGLPEMDESQFFEALEEFKRIACIFSEQIQKKECQLNLANEAHLTTIKLLHFIAHQRLILKCHTIIHTSSDRSYAVDQILALSGEELGFSRTYVMEKNVSGLMTVTHEWRNEDTAPIPWKNRVFLIDDSSNIVYTKPGLIFTDTNSQNIHTHFINCAGNAVHLPFFSEDGLEGVVIFEECEGERSSLSLDKKQLYALMLSIGGIILRERAQEKASHSSAVKNSIMNNPYLAVFAFDPQTQEVLFVNDFCADNVGVPKEEIISAKDIFAEIAEPGFQIKPGETKELSQNGRVFLITAREILWENGSTAHLVTFANIAANIERENLIESLAFIDPLLGIPNRRQFELDLKEALRINGKKGSGGLVFMDLDDFKQLNDIFGHNRGDLLLKAIAAFFQGLKSTAKRLYRLGGDEFTLILNGFSSESIADTVEQVWQRFQQPWNLDELSIYCTVSIGVSRFPEDGDDPTELMRFADLAMYKSKYEGKNSAVYFRKGLESRVTKRMALENRLRAAVKDDFKDFEVYYQPIFRLTDAKVSGVEALLRWRDAKGRLLYPEAFLDTAESLGLMSALGAFVLKTALQDMKPYCNPGFLTVVNLSMRQFQNESLPSEIDSILKTAKIPPQCLILGVSESAALFDAQSGDNTLGALRKLGAYISLDNKGNSYNALSRVVRENIDFVNIDISLVGSMQRDDFCDTVVRSSIELAKSAGCGVFCAGVEIQEQYLDLKEYGCDYAQGFFFTHAMSLKDFDAYMLNIASQKGKQRLTGRLLL